MRPVKPYTKTGSDCPLKRAQSTSSRLSWIIVGFGLIIITRKLPVKSFMIFSCVILLGALFVFNFVFFKQKGGTRRCGTWSVLLSLFLLVIAARFYRFRGYWPENVVYQTEIGAYSVLERLKAGENAPFRAGTVGTPQPWVLTLSGIESVDARGPMFNARYAELFKLFVAPQSTSLYPGEERYFNRRYFDSLHLVGRSAVQDFNYDLLALSNVKYLVSDRDIPEVSERSRSVMRFNPKSGVPFIKQSPIIVYELREFLPRAFLASSVQILPDSNAVLDRMKLAPVDELSTVVFFESDDSDNRIREFVGKKGPVGGAVVEFSQYSCDKMRLTVSVKAPGILVVSNNFHPNWTAMVNDAPARVYRADHAFQAIVLDTPGEHEVSFRYSDETLVWLNGLVPLGFLLTNLGFFLFRRRVHLASGS